MKKCILTILIGLSITVVQAQHYEFGFGIGGFNYAGDMVRGYNPSYIRPGLTAFYKYNFNSMTALRFGASGGLLSGGDDTPYDKLGEFRKGSFNINIVEASALFEYNFIHFRDPKSLNKWSPFLFMGVGVMTFFGENYQGDYSSFQPVLPFGMGAKVKLGKRFSLNAEWGIRMTFFDHLDGVSDGNLANKNFKYGNKYDNDWYNFFNVSVSYIIKEIPCPYDFY